MKKETPTEIILASTAIVAVGLKLTHCIDISWWWILAPVWIYLSMYLFLASVLYLARIYDRKGK